MKIAIPLLLAAALAQEANPPAPKAEPAVPTDRLPTLGTVGDLPPEKERLVVEVDAKGKITVEGKVLDLVVFRKVLLERADADRETEGATSSRLHLVLRADRDVPWQGAQWLMQECAAPKVRVRRIFFAARPEDGGEEGAMATYLPVDAGIGKGEAFVKTVADLRLRVRPDGNGAAPADAADRIAALREKDLEMRGLIDAAPAVPTGTALRAVDVFLRVGVKEVTFKGTTPLRAASIEAALAARDPVEGTPAVFVLDTRVEKSDPPASLKPVARVTGKIAGITSVTSLMELEPALLEGR